MRVLVAAVLACSACYTPSPQAGSPCMRDHDCPSSLVCSPATNTCERTSADPDVDAQPIDAHLVDGCTPTREICGNGIDEDCDAIDPACLANDVGAGAVDVTAGGTFTADALLARDDVAADGCGEGGGRDVFFQVDLTAPQVYYVDTFGSNFDTVIRVFERPCAMVGGGGNAKACVDDACGGTQGQIAVSLPAGKSCIVIDQRAGAELGGNVTLHVVKGGRDGKPLATGVQTTTSDTCSATNASEPLDMNCDGPGAGGKDHAYFFTTCPNQTLKLDADLCPAPNWDAVLYVKRVTGEQLGCNDDSCGNGPMIANVPITGAPLYFLFVDGFDPTFCGTYSLDTNLRP